MINFGFSISKPRTIDIDRNNLRKSNEITSEMPELQTCIGCGTCTATCTAGNLTEFNFRKVHTLVRRGAQNPIAMVQISHGMCEYFLRYEGFAEYLAAHGILVFGHDHLGHGNSAPSPEDLGFTASSGGAGMLIEDVHLLSLEMKAQYPHLPLILFGHSMGSFVARTHLIKYPGRLTGALISGTAQQPQVGVFVNSYENNFWRNGATLLWVE